MMFKGTVNKEWLNCAVCSLQGTEAAAYLLVLLHISNAYTYPPPPTTVDRFRKKEKKEGS